MHDTQLNGFFQIEKGHRSFIDSVYTITQHKIHWSTISFAQLRYLCAIMHSLSVVDRHSTLNCSTYSFNQYLSITSAVKLWWPKHGQWLTSSFISSAHLQPSAHPSSATPTSGSALTDEACDRYIFKIIKTFW